MKLNHLYKSIVYWKDIIYWRVLLFLFMRDHKWILTHRPHYMKGTYSVSFKGLLKKREHIYLLLNKLSSLDWVLMSTKRVSPTGEIRQFIHCQGSKREIINYYKKGYGR